jgi:hypothetical protein
MSSKIDLKEKFSNNKVPTGSDFLDFIDSCFNNSVSGNVTFNDFVEFKKYIKCENFILTSNNGTQYKIFVDNNGDLKTEEVLVD